MKGKYKLDELVFYFQNQQQKQIIDEKETEESFDAGEATPTS